MGIRFRLCCWLGFVAVLLTACGGGGGGDAESVQNNVAISGGHGSLAVSGSGAGTGSFTPNLFPTAQEIGPICNGVGLGCLSSLLVEWDKTSGATIRISFYSSAAAPGSAPGTAVNDIFIVFSQGGSELFAKQCGVLETQSPCTVASLGVTLNTAQRTVNFANTTLPSDSSASQVVLNGTLSY